MALYRRRKRHATINIPLDAPASGMKAKICNAPCIDPLGSGSGLRPFDSRVRESDGSNFLSINATRSIEDLTYSDTSLNGQIFIGFTPCKEGLFNIPENFTYASSEFFANWEGNSYELRNRF